MKKLTLILVSLFYVACLLSVSAFAAKSSNSATGIDPRDIVAESSKRPLTDVQLQQLNRPVKTAGSNSTALGFMASPGILIGNSAYDIQHNSAMGHQIVQGGDGRVHFVWTHTLVANTLREVRYGSYRPSISTFFDLPGGLVVSDAREGHMCNVDQISNAALPVWRYGASFAAYRSTSALDFASGAGAFTIVDVPSTAPTCENIWAGTTTEPYIWPRVAGDVDGSLNPVVHLVAMEGNSGSDFSAMAYYRGTGSPFTTYTSCGTFIDSTQAISYSIAQDPNSNKVAIAYTKSRQNVGSRANNDAVYRLSTDLGVSWGPVVNITNYATGTKERANQEANCVFTSDGCFHVVYTAAFYDSVAGQIADQEGKLYHYDDCNQCISLIIDANNVHENCEMKAFEANVCRASLAECTVGATKTLYVVYTRYVGDTNPSTPALTDCSAGGFPNGEIYAQASSTDGETWGPPVNLTNSRTDGCTAGNCDDDNFATVAPHSTDSLYIEYMNDKDAGSAIGNDATAETYSPIMYLGRACFPMDTYRNVTANPAGLVYPLLHAAPGGQDSENLVLTNSGNASATWTRTITYNSGSGWLNVPAGGTVTAGCTNSQTLLVTAGPIGTEGYYSATINFTYEGPTQFQVPVEFFVFNNFFLPQDAAIRTSLVRMNVAQVGRTSHQETGRMFYFFSDQTEPMFDGSLVLGNSAANLSYQIFEGGGSAPSANNPFGYLYAQSNTSYDSTTFSAYRMASGRGSNRDTTLGFIVDYYAPKHPDTAKVILASYRLFKGANNPTGTVSGLTIAYALDVDVQDDSSENIGGSDASRQAVYQRGKYGADQNRYAGMRGVRRDNTALAGGFVWENDVTVYPLGGYENDTLWNKLAATSGYSVTDSTEDLNSVLIIQKNATVNGANNDTLRFAVIFAATEGSTSLADFQAILDRGKAWLCSYVYSGAPACALCKCGDADNSGAWSISDAVYLINYIFAGGPAPAQVCLGDADGSKAISISDAVYLINYIFAGGPAPAGCI